jgi:hypothetical protein
MPQLQLPQVHISCHTQLTFPEYKSQEQIEEFDVSDDDILSEDHGTFSFNQQNTNTSTTNNDGDEYELFLFRP